MSPRTRCLLVCAAIGALATSCVRFIGPEDVRLDLSDQAGVKLRQATGLTLTRSGVWLARQFVDDDDVPLRGVRRVEIGVYEVKGLKRGLEVARPIDADYFRDWQSVVRVHEEDEDVMVFVREKDERIRALLVVVAEPDEWVLVRVRGHLDDLVEQVMQMAFEQVERPDLYAKTRCARGLDPAPSASTCEAPGG